jgi:integrase
MAYRPAAKWLKTQKRWQLNCYNDAGIRKTLSSYIPGRAGQKDCQDKADDWIRNGIVSTTAKLEAYLEQYLAHLEIYSSKSDYVSRKVHIDNHISILLGNAKLASITEADWELVLRRAAGKGLSHKYISDICGTIVHFCKWARKRKYIAAVPELDRSVYKRAPRGVRRILQVTDISTLFSPFRVLCLFRGEEISCRNIFLFRFLFLSGFRLGETIGLRKTDINIEEHTITISQAINYFGEITAGKTVNAQRKIYMTPQLEAVVAEQLLFAKQIKSKYVFPDHNLERLGQPQQQTMVYKDWRRWTKYNHVEYCSLHELRHTFISYTRNHVSLERIKDYVGHSEQMDTSKVYGHLVVMEMKTTAEEIAKVFDKLMNPAEVAEDVGSENIVVNECSVLEV